MRLLDRTAMCMAAARVPLPDGSSPHLIEARQLLERPDFMPAEAGAAQVKFSGNIRFQFESPCPSAFAENNVVHGRFYHCSGNWQRRPCVVMLHGWNDVIDHSIRFPLAARQFNRHGINAATLELPYHFQRRPRQLGAWGNFLCPDLLRMVEAARQAVAESRAFAQWLRQEGCPAVGLVGVSLGGWLAGLAVSHDARFACAVLMEPAARLDALVESAVFCRGIRLALGGQPLPAMNLNLTSVRPVISKENILIIESIYDLFVPAEITEELWRAWGQPEIWRLSHSHISILMAPGLYARIIRWMAPRLAAPAK
ncbi:MAG TPA: alpha/beta fold hydrolase [Verrucomicrobiae bacterium]